MGYVDVFNRETDNNYNYQIERKLTLGVFSSITLSVDSDYSRVNTFSILEIESPT